MEPQRSGWQKTYIDLKKICNLNQYDEVVFIDDQVHEKMFHPNVKYFKLEAYIYKYHSYDMMKKYVKKTPLEKTKKEYLLNNNNFINNNRNNFSNVNLYKKSIKYKVAGKILYKGVKNFLDCDNSNEFIIKIK